MKQSDLVAIGTVPLPERNTIRVTIPASVAFNFDKMQKVTASVLERLGHAACHSGFDIRFDLARRFQFDDKLNIRELAEGGVIIDS